MRYLLPVLSTTNMPAGGDDRVTAMARYATCPTCNGKRTVMDWAAVSCACPTCGWDSSGSFGSGTVPVRGREVMLRRWA